MDLGEPPTSELSLPAVQILNTLNVPYETVNILEDELLRTGMKEYSQWPTFPQVYIDGEFYGGCDIMIGRLLVGGSCGKSRCCQYSHAVPWSEASFDNWCEQRGCTAESYTNGELKEQLEAALNS